MLNFVRKNVKIDYFVKDLQNFVQEAKIEPNSSWSQIRIYGAKPIFKRPNLRNLAPKRPKWPPCSCKHALLPHQFHDSRFKKNTW